MAWYESHFAGLPVAHLPEVSHPKATRADNARARRPQAPPPAAADAAWALRVPGYQPSESYDAHFARFVETVRTEDVSAIVIGTWGEYGESSANAIRLLCEHADRLPKLRHLHLGDISSEENEISWIQQSDITPLLTTFPTLRTLVVKGGDGLVLDPVGHPALRTLEFQSGGLPGGIPRALGAGAFPALQSLELWLGVENYGGDTTVADLAGILRGDGLPALTELGLMNSEIQDEIAAAIGSAPIVSRLTALDLSMGTLGDEGAEALLTGQPLTHLARLNLRHHFIGEAMQRRLRDALQGVALNLDDPEEAEEWGDGQEWRYTEVAE
ncbi:STM4015 family protein [Yinghuangia sp. YIM S09857]|uniref:STM4015 family protein n=1 Tax=Yinghuangia sp. YIM S09857 TaxID=3436929 RepID=UPI003F53CEB2